MAATRNFVCVGHKLRPSVRLSGITSAFVPSRSSSSSDGNQKVTHTGQLWEPDDYRNSRFVDRKKLVNENWAIKLIDEVPPEARKERVVWCDGGGGPLGHPKVYINLDKPGNQICGYCGLRFYKDQHHH